MAHTSDLQKRAHTTELVAVAQGGAVADGFSIAPKISADGRHVTFWSEASNLVANDANGTSDVFVRNLAADVTERVSVAGHGAEANDGSFSPPMTPNGRDVAFLSQASNLVLGDTNHAADVFVRDR